jgi:thiamine biosynthesis protein ThiS
MPAKGVGHGRLARALFFMQIKINGEMREFKEPASLHQLLTAMGVVLNRAAVELNGKVIPKSKWGEVSIKENDQLEIVTLIAGG